VKASCLPVVYLRGSGSSLLGSSDLQMACSIFSAFSQSLHTALLCERNASPMQGLQPVKEESMNHLRKAVFLNGDG
jgi:hypothetical protein